MSNTWHKKRHTAEQDFRNSKYEIKNAMRKKKQAKHQHRDIFYEVMETTNAKFTH